MSTIDLRYTYKPGTTKGDDPKLRGEPDSSLFNRNEYHEVYYLVKHFVSRYKNVTVEKTERLIHEKLPGSVRSQANVIEWLAKNYTSHT